MYQPHIKAIRLIEDRTGSAFVRHFTVSKHVMSHVGKPDIPELFRNMLQITQIGGNAMQAHFLLRNLVLIQR
jgi:hypothetical protein